MPRMDFNDAVASALRAERMIAKLTVRELSEAAGVPLSSLMRILGGERDIKVAQLARLADALRLYPHEILEHAEMLMERAARGDEWKPAGSQDKRDDD